MTNVVYFVVDRKYLPLALANAGVLIRQGPHNFDIVIFYEDREPISLQIPAGVQVISQALMPKVPDAAGSSVFFGKVNWAHLFAPFVLRGRYRRGLYCDADLSFFGPVDRLFDLDLRDAPFAAVTDPGFISTAFTPHIAAAGVTNGRYANSGVLLIDLDAWCGHDINDRLVAYCSRYEAKFVDQDFINCAFQNDWLELSPLWNFQSTLVPFGLDRVLRPAVYHYVSNARPWKEDSPPFDPVHRRYFDDALAAVGAPSFLDAIGYRHRLGRRLELAVTDWLYNVPRLSRRKQKAYDLWARHYRAVYMYLKDGLSEGRFADVTQGMSTIELAAVPCDPPALHETVYRHRWILGKVSRG